MAGARGRSSVVCSTPVGGADRCQRGPITLHPVALLVEDEIREPQLSTGRHLATAGYGPAQQDPGAVAAALDCPVGRDAQVDGPWQREPAHLADREASVYGNPCFGCGGRMTAPLARTRGPVDVEGGWYDAGDFLKFTHTTARAFIAMLIVQRDGLAPAGLDAEIRHEVDWLGKMWDADAGTLYTQVGISSGLQSGNQGFLGDRDSWRLPQADDRLAVTAGDARYYQRYRPVFRAAEPGGPLSPNLAGRVAVAYALAAQVEAGTDLARAKGHLGAAH